MDKLKYIDNLLKLDDSKFNNYIKYLEKSNLQSPPEDLKDKILKKCNPIKSYKYINIKTKQKSFLDFIKIACFVLLITTFTDLLVGSTYASNKENQKKPEFIEKLSKRHDCFNNDLKDFMHNFKGFMMNNNLKGD
ncbi:MAG: hypothetical protein PHR25_02530 [Clostridia bacterium]|nr:hypothetical protein [Clostridia bacterium]